MATINDYFDNIQMAFASYADLYKGINNTDFKDALDDVGMAQTQYEQFTSTYTVIDSQPNTDEGFSATVFKKNGVEEYTLAIRGTEPGLTLINDLLRADIADIGGDGIAVSQALDLFNYYQKLTAVKDQTIYQYSLVANPMDQYDILLGGLGWITAKPIKATEKGVLVGKNFDVAGHSLGGHLAMIMGRLDPARVNEVYTYNAPGFDTGLVPGFDNTELFFQRLAERQTQVSGSSTIDVNANSFPINKFNTFAIPLDAISDIGTTPGSLIEHFGESTTTVPILSQLEAHDKKTISDAFAVYNLLATLQPTLTLDDLTPILQNADYYDPSILESLFGSSTNISLENIVNGMGNLFGAGEMAHPGDRDELYKRINDIQGSVEYKRYEGTVSIRSTEGISVEAGNSLAYRYAVMNLNSFAVLADDMLYDRFSSELALYDPLLRTGELTNNLVQDKSYFLNQLLTFNKSDDIDNPPVGNTTEFFYDFKTKKSMNIGLLHYITGDKNAKRYIFGDGGANQLKGGNGADKLYGGGGNDSLKGTQYSNEDNAIDYMEGGRGDDTYYVGAGDVVMDTDGVGELIYTDAAGTPYTFTGGRLVGGSYVSDDNKASYALSGTTLTITMQGVNDAITVNNFNDGDLGITLAGEWNTQIDYIFNMPYPPTGVPYETYINTNVLYNLPSTNTDAFVVQAGTGNDIFTGNYRTNRWYITEAALNAELEAYKATNGFYFPYGGNFRAGDGDDRYFAGTPSDLSVMLDPNNTNNELERFYVTALGGAGNDMLVGSNGKDNLIGGTGNDTIISGPGDDIIYGYGGAKYIDLVGVNVPDIFKEDASDPFFVKLLGNESNDADVIYAGSGDDWVYAEFGDDTVYGGLGVDVLRGMEGNDTLIGGAGNPDSFTHDYIQRAA